WQALNRTGGAAKVSHIEKSAGVVHADERRVVAVTPADGFGAASFEEGDITSFLTRGALPEASSTDDPFSRASAAWSWKLSLERGETRDVWLAVPWTFDSDVVEPEPASKTSPRHSDERLDRLFASTKAQWRSTLDAAG